MLLAIDIGNTHTVVGFFTDGTVLKRTWRLSTNPIGTSDEFLIKLKTLLDQEGMSFQGIKASVVSSVVPKYTGVLRKAFQNQQIPFHSVDSTWPFSYAIAASPASDVGADRLVNAEAAVRAYGTPVLVVDSGTATTICAISADRRYLGGAIMPGIELSAEVLAAKTAKLFSVELTAPENVVGSNTQDALKSGLIWGYTSMIDGMIRKFREELGLPHCPVVATGGVSLLLRGITSEKMEFDPDLTLKGIAYLYESISSRKS